MNIKYEFKRLIFMMIGVFTGNYLMSLRGEKMDFSTIFGTIVGVFIAFGLFQSVSFFQKKKTKGIPISDERGQMRGQSFILITFYCLLYLGGFIILLLHTVGGIDVITIKLMTLLQIFVGIQIFIGIGYGIVKRL